jgi:hypothetical protein
MSRLISALIVCAAAALLSGCRVGEACDANRACLSGLECRCTGTGPNPCETRVCVDPKHAPAAADSQQPAAQPPAAQPPAAQPPAAQPPAAQPPAAQPPAPSR